MATSVLNGGQFRSHMAGECDTSLGYIIPFGVSRQRFGETLHCRFRRRFCGLQARLQEPRISDDARVRALGLYRGPKEELTGQ